METFKLSIAAFIGVLFYTHSTTSFADETFAPWLTQIGLTHDIASAAQWGKNVKLGIVDTGIYASSPFFSAGQISKNSSKCAALTFTCTSGYSDDHGHGTAVASIAAGSKYFSWESNYGGYAVSQNSVVSVAPSANIIAQKVLNASGSGYTTDVANGIKKAADAGASVINVSISYANNAEIINSINYAAGKGAYIVWAGGNSASNLLSNADTHGLTSTALNRLVFAGAVDANNQKSSFSNTPGTGNLNTADSSTGYAQRWLMAPGEHLLAAYNPSEPSAWGYWSGTSMSAPLVSGSLVLLQAAWPILKTNGSAVDLLLATATDLGDAGVDSTYGGGLVNLTQAFAPVGDLTVKNTKKQTVLVNDLTGTMLTSGALGKLSKIKSKLSNYTAFDGYQRNFRVNLSGLIQSTDASASLNPLPAYARTQAKKIKLIDGSTVSAWTESQTPDFEKLGRFGFNPSQENAQESVYFALNTKDGTSYSIGNGYSTQYAYANALLDDEGLATLSSELATSTFSSLTLGGKMLNIGANLDQNTRVAFSWSHRESDAASDQALFDNASTLFKAGFNYKLNEKIQSGVSLSFLNERNGLIGSQLAENSALGFNADNKSIGVDFSLALHLDENNQLLIEKGFTKTQAANGNGLINKTSAIEAQSFGSTFISQHVFEKNDALKISIKQPLRVTSGEAALITASVDAQGYAVYKNAWTDLAPSGKETHFMLSYEKNLSPTELIKFETNYKKNLLNVNGDHDANISVYYQIHY